MVTLKYSKRDVNRAGKTLINSDTTVEEQKEAKSIVSNWRACYTTPLNTFQTTLRERLKNIDDKALVSQRLKRMPSIIAKLKRQESMKLVQMQDIGGLRAIVKDIDTLREVESVYRESEVTHSLVGKGKDYIDEPKESGYRGIHLVYKYKDEKNIDYNGLFIELQIRTQIQHCWATAVETMGTFIQYSLKSNEGPNEWLDFFALAGSAFSWLEKTPQVPKFSDLTELDTYKKLLDEEKHLDVINRLTGFRIAANHIENDKSGGSYHLVILNLDKHSVHINSYREKKLSEANAAYYQYEEKALKGENLQVVLVKSSSISNLKKTYPSYFLDTDLFIQQLDKIYEEIKKDTEKRTKIAIGIGLIAGIAGSFIYHLLKKDKKKG